MSKGANAIKDRKDRAEILNDMCVLGTAYSLLAAERLKALFGAKYANHENGQVAQVYNEKFVKVWGNSNLYKWTAAHARNSVVNTNGLESNNCNIKNEITERAIIPVVTFCKKSLDYLSEQSLNRDPQHPYCKTFALTPTLTTKAWTEAMEWKQSNRKQLRLLEDVNYYVTISSRTLGELTEDKARSILKQYEECSWETFDLYAITHHNVCVLIPDATRAEGYRGTCQKNAKEFTCIHSLGVAILRRTMLPPNVAGATLLGRRKRKGRRPQAGSAWDLMPLDIRSPVHHAQQDALILAGGGGVAAVGAGAGGLEYGGAGNEDLEVIGVAAGGENGAEIGVVALQF